MNPDVMGETSSWKLLVVDVNADVHLATELALENERILGRSLSFLHAYTPEEARAILGREGQDIAVVLLDVVVANELAGLGLVRHIRDELGLHEVRIVLRTDQARYAPETEVIRDYDINDYRFKSELGSARLYATITAAVRAYHQIHQLGIARRGLERIVRASGQCVLQQDYRGFAAGLMDMMADLLEMPLQGVVCERKWPRAGEPEPPATILAAGTRHSAELGRRIDQVEDATLRNALLRVLHTRQNLIEAHTASLHLPGSRDCDLLVHLEADRTLSEVDRALLEVLGTNAALCFQNVLNVSRLRDYAFRDPLLDLPNQLALAQIIDEHCRHPHASAATLCLLEIDHFEQFRNALGQGFGDRLLAAVHQRIRSHLDPRVTIARVGKDSFGLFGPEASIDPNNILSCFHRPLPIDESEHTIAVSLGLVRLGEIGHGQGSDAMQSANIALEHAKLTRRADYSYFGAQMEAEIKDRVQLLQDLRRAVKEERLFLVYQPQIDLAHGRPVGAEALLRWRDEQGQFISPARFIPVAESSRLIVSLGEWVLRMACEDLGRILDSGMDRFRMAVNVSLAQFGHPLFLERVDAILTETGVPAANLELEITESMAMLELDYVVQTLAALKRRGITVAVDDFGTGFSSLSYLERLKLDRLKLDQYFVRQSALSPGCAHIAETIVELGRRLNLVVIAEGVDQPEQITWLRGLGCHEAQGFHIARPMPAAELMDWLRTRP